LGGDGVIGASTMRVAIYARVSTTDQNCETQLLELRSYAEARGWEIQREYVDAGWSGSKASRPELDRLMKDALSRKVDTIAVFKLDRWGRSVRHIADSLAQLRDAGVRFIATTQGIDTIASNPTTDFLLNILAACAQLERELIRERVAAGMKRAAVTGTRSGKAIGRPRVIVDRKPVWDLREAGLSISAIERETGLSRGTVQRILAAKLVR
jgi:DNA invertase Pin-like site-specific DNA recombinase